MKTKITYIVFTLLIMVMGTNAYADNTKGKKEKKAKAEKVFNKIESTFETELRFENWMTEIREFTGKEIFREDDLSFESWMMQDFSQKDAVNFHEDDLKMEPWMTSVFNETAEASCESNSMKFEPWMLKTF